MKHNLDLGQHFMINNNLLDEVIKSAEINQDEIVLEVGSGQGALSEKILEKNPTKLICVEIDERLKLEHEKITFIQGNILEKINDIKFDNFVANIPYHISEPLMIKLMLLGTRKITMVCGKKFADALLGETIIGLVSQSKYEIKIVQEISPGMFNPPPKVDSALVTMRLKTDNNLFLSFYEHQKQKVKNYLITISEGKKTKKEIKELITEIEDINDLSLYTLNYNQYKQVYTFINKHLLY